MTDHLGTSSSESFQCWRFPLSLKQEQDAVVALGSCHGDVGRVYPSSFSTFPLCPQAVPGFKVIFNIFI